MTRHEREDSMKYDVMKAKAWCNERLAPGSVPPFRVSCFMSAGLVSPRRQACECFLMQGTEKDIEKDCGKVFESPMQQEAKHWTYYIIIYIG